MASLTPSLDTIRRDAGAVPTPRRGVRALDVAAATWLGVAIVGQLVFAAYVVAFYGATAFGGDFAAWNKVLPHGHVPGESFGNAVIAAHLAFTVLIIVAGAIQVLPVVRRRWPRVHRWSGRTYLVASVVMATSGLAMMALRGSIGGGAQKLAIIVNALLILVFAALAWRAAIARRIDAHRRWAMRLFLAVAGVWFFRLLLTFWLAANGGPVGFDPVTFTGPALVAFGFGQYLLPLAIHELYLRAKTAGGATVRAFATATLALATLVTAAGTATATMILWLPRV